MADVELRMSFPDLAALERELAQNLKYGRAFLPEVADASVLSDCVLLLVHPSNGAELRVPAQIVMLSAEGAMRGTGIEVRPFNPTVQAEIESFVRDPQPTAAAPEAEQDAAPEVAPMLEDAVPALQTEPALDLEAAEHGECAEDAVELQSTDDAQDASDADGPDADPGVDDTMPDDPALDAEHASQLADGKSMPPDVQLESKQDKLRHLTAAEQVKVARRGELNDRLVVERLYGKQVWEALLHNPRLTVPEVARIARKGSVPKPLIELIVENATWIKAPQVRRALLSNPKVGADSVMKLLRVTPKHELKLIEKGTAYAPPVRDAARKLLKQ